MVVDLTDALRFARQQEESNNYGEVRHMCFSIMKSLVRKIVDIKTGDKDVSVGTINVDQS